MLPSRKIPIAIERPTSPSVKTILHQYYINKNKEKNREKSILQTVQDNNEIDFVDSNVNDKYQSNESLNSKFEKFSNKNKFNENVNDPAMVSLKYNADFEFKDSSEIGTNNERLDGCFDIKSLSYDNNYNYGLKIKSSDFKVVQVNDYELNKFERKIMDDKKIAKSLDLSQSIAETLVNCAIKAGSVENITVNCVLLPGCNL